LITSLARPASGNEKSTPGDLVVLGGVAQAPRNGVEDE
jgi:hypothetical protein